MIILAIDPAATTGIALIRDGVPIFARAVQHCDKAMGARELGDWLARLELDFRPNVVLVEDVIQQVVGITNRKGNVSQLRTYRGVRDVVIGTFGFARLRDVPVATWQTIHDGLIGTSKDKSLQVVQRSRATAEVLAVCEGSHDCCDAVAIGLWGSQQKG